MSKRDNLTDFLTDIANAIRTKKGISGPINAQNFASEILSISADSDLKVQILKFVDPQSSEAIDTVKIYLCTDDRWAGQGISSSYVVPSLKGAMTDVVYQVSDSGVVQINPSTGMFYPIKTGKVVVTATAVATDTYMQGVAFYNVVIANMPIGIDVFDNTDNQPTTMSDYKTSFDLSKYSFDLDYVGTGTPDYMSYNTSGFRWCKETRLSLTPKNIAIKEYELWTSNNYTNKVSKEHGKNLEKAEIETMGSYYKIRLVAIDPTKPVIADNIGSNCRVQTIKIHYYQY